MATFTPTMKNRQRFEGRTKSGVLGVVLCLCAGSAAGRTITSQPTVVRVTAASAESWEGRIADPGVVWFHNFDSATEVNQFRWTNGYKGGNDPQAKGVDGSAVAWVSSGGIEGGSFMRLSYAGDGKGHGGSYWHRPFNPFTGATNGRGVDDPGANGAVPLAAFSVSDGSSTLYDWGASAAPGWYGNPKEQAKNPTKFQGNDFYLQVRIRRAQSPGAPPDSANYQYITGKSVWLTTTPSSYTAQELVTFGQSVLNETTYHDQTINNVYLGQNFSPVDEQSGGTVTTSNTKTVKWRYSGGWDTLYYHLTPGTADGTGDDRTHLEVWAQHDPTATPAEAGQYTKIWDVWFSNGYTSGTDSAGRAVYANGWNALILAIYHNGSPFTTAFSYDYDQLIFSRAPIRAPLN